MLLDACVELVVTEVLVQFTGNTAEHCSVGQDGNPTAAG